MDIDMFFFSAPQAIQHFLGTMFGPLSNGSITAAPAYDSANGKSNNGKVSVSHTSFAAGVGNRFKNFYQIGRLLSGKLHRRLLSNKLRIGVWIPELEKRLLTEGAHENGLGLSMMDITEGMFAVTACLPKVKPVGCLIAGPRKAFGIYKCFRYQYRVSVNMHPVPGKTAQIKTQNP